MTTYTYDKDGLPVIHRDGKRLQPYHGPWGKSGLSTKPACRREYRGKNPAGGRKVPASYIGAAERRWRISWTRGLDRGMGEGKQVRVRLVLGDEQLTLMPDEID